MKKQLLLILTLLALLAGCGQTGKPPAEAGDSSIQPAVLEGEALSPDGRFLARTEGQSEGVTSAGLYPAEKVQITDAETGAVLWEGDGAYGQSILWSPEGGFAALARSGRTWCSITVIETEGWTEWDFSLPDGSPIPEYTFLPDGGSWGVWQAEDSLDLTIGRGGDAGEQRFYSCGVHVTDGRLKGIVWEETHEPLPGSYDFDHDGEPDIVELVKVHDSREPDAVWSYGLRVRTADNRLYWSRGLHEAHPGWGSYFACRADGEDYLLRYLPTMYQGFASYGYQLFSLSGGGEESVVREGSVSFDINFGSPMHGDFDPAAIADFLEEVHGLLAEGELLVSTEGGTFRTGGSGADFWCDVDFWQNDPLCAYDGGLSLEENLRNLESAYREAAG